MKAKTIVTVVLLAFVAVSVVYLVIKESGGKSGTPIAPQADQQSTSTTTAPQAPNLSEQKRNIPLLQTAETKEPSQNAVSSEKKVIQHKVVAYYFHGNMRCMTCRTIEAYTKEAIDTAFAEDIKNRRLEWKVINVDESENEHFVRDFQLVTRSVVIQELSNGRPTRWKNLKQVWQLVRNKGAFLKYIQDETRAYLEDSGP